jgi:hypothetical protein
MVEVVAFSFQRKSIPLQSVFLPFAILIVERERASGIGF